MNTVIKYIYYKNVNQLIGVDKVKLLYFNSVLSTENTILDVKFLSEDPKVDVFSQNLKVLYLIVKMSTPPYFSTVP